jgi:hypothetical protein
MNKTVIGLCCGIGFIVLYSLLIRERWTTPADELRAVLGFQHQLATLEVNSVQVSGRYAALDTILNSALNTGRFRIADKCQSGYCFFVDLRGNGYSIRIRPQDKAKANFLSIYADETGVVRVSYGQPQADEQSPRLSSEELRRYMPN